MTLHLTRSVLSRYLLEQIRTKQVSVHLHKQLTVRQLSCSIVLRKKKDESLQDTEDRVDVNQSLKKAARSVAESLPGDAKNTESDLLKQLRLLSKRDGGQSKEDDGHEAEPESGKQKKLKSILAAMKMEPKQSKAQTRGIVQDPEERLRSQRSKMEIDKRRQELSDTIKLFEGPGLGIFTSQSQVEPPKKSTISKRQSLWDKLEAESLDRLARFPPQNAFEEMIQMTKEGKLWTFPIDNEAGMVRERNVGFHEHVFLDRLIEDFPQRGPIRHFMELVTTGLSQNPYLSVKQKEKHIDWFRRYFNEKQTVLEESLGPDGIMKTLQDDSKQQ